MNTFCMENLWDKTANGDGQNKDVHRCPVLNSATCQCVFLSDKGLVYIHPASYTPFTQVKSQLPVPGLDSSFKQQLSPARKSLQNEYRKR